MSAHRHNRRLHVWVLASYLLVMAVAALSPWLGEAPLGPLCRSGASAGWAAVAGDGPDSDTLHCAACLPLQLASTLPRDLPLPSLAADSWRAQSHMPFIDPHRVALPPARGPPLV